MNPVLRIGGAWRPIVGAKVYLGGSWRTLTRGEIYKGGAWHTLFTFVPALTLTVSPGSVSGFANTHSATTIVAGTLTATPSGGLGPYTYSWSAAPFTATNPTGSSSSFSAVVNANDSVDGPVTCTVTDSLGHTAYASGEVNLTNFDF